MARVTTAFLAALIFVCAHAYAWPGRAASSRAEFMAANPCPATGATRGACRGWQVDHITPLKCGGADAPTNMQWLTVEQHKIKTRAEARDCRRPRRASAPATSPP